MLYVHIYSGGRAVRDNRVFGTLHAVAFSKAAFIFYCALPARVQFMNSVVGSTTKFARFIASCTYFNDIITVREQIVPRQPIVY